MFAYNQIIIRIAMVFLRATKYLLWSDRSNVVQSYDYKDENILDLRGSFHTKREVS